MDGELPCHAGECGRRSEVGGPGWDGTGGRENWEGADTGRSWLGGFPSVAGRGNGADLGGLTVAGDSGGLSSQLGGWRPGFVRLADRKVCLPSGSEEACLRAYPHRQAPCKERDLSRWAPTQRRETLAKTGKGVGGGLSCRDHAALSANGRRTRGHGKTRIAERAVTARRSRVQCQTAARADGKGLPSWRRAVSSRGPLPRGGVPGCSGTPRSAGSSKASRPPGCWPAGAGDEPTAGSSRGD